MVVSTVILKILIYKSDRMEQSNKIKRSDVWNNIYEVLARLDLKESTGDALDRPSAATEIEELFLKLLGLQNVSLSLPTLKQINDDAIIYSEKVHPNYKMKTFRAYSRTDYVNGAIAIRNKWIKSNER